MTLDSFKLKLEKARNFYLKKTLSEQNLSKKDWMSYCQRKIFSSSKFLEEVQNKIVRGMILKINSFVVWSNKTWSMTNFTSMKDKLNLNIQTKMRESPSLMEWKLQLKKFIMKYPNQLSASKRSQTFLWRFNNAWKTSRHSKVHLAAICLRGHLSSKNCLSMEWPL